MIMVKLDRVRRVTKPEYMMHALSTPQNLIRSINLHRLLWTHSNANSITYITVQQARTDRHLKKLNYFLSCASPDGWAVWCVVMSTRWWLLVDHCVLRNWWSNPGQGSKGLAWSRYVHYCDKETLNSNKPKLLILWDHPSGGWWGWWMCIGPIAPWTSPIPTHW